MSHNSEESAMAALVFSMEQDYPVEQLQSQQQPSSSNFNNVVTYPDNPTGNVVINNNATSLNTSDDPASNLHVPTIIPCRSSNELLTSQTSTAMVPSVTNLRNTTNGSNSKKNHTCDECGKQFKSRDHLKKHLARHAKERTFQCDICDKAYYTVWELNQHKKVHKGETICKICKKTFSRIRNLRKHINRNTSNTDDINKFNCCYPYCRHQFNTEKEAEEHFLTHTRFECNICSKKLDSSRSLHDHIQFHRHQQEGKTTCNICKKMFSNIPNLRRHINRNKSNTDDINKFSCCYHRCRHQFNTEKDLEEHFSTHTRF